MFSRPALLSLATLLFMTSAHAEDIGAQNTPEGPSNTGSQYLHQATGGTFELSPFTGVMSRKQSAKASQNKRESTLLPLGVMGEYGFSDLFSLSGRLAVGIGGTDAICPGTTCDDTVQSGLFDPIITANFRIPVGIAALRFGADISSSIGKRKLDKDGDSNLATGGTKFAPFFGAEFLLTNMIIGGRVSYDLFKSERETQDDTPPAGSYKESKRQETNAAIFYEYNFPKIVSLGAALNYKDSAATEIKSSGSKTELYDKSSTIGLEIYVPLRFTPRVTLIPRLASASTNYKSSSAGIKDDSMTELSVLARFAF